MIVLDASAALAIVMGTEEGLDMSSLLMEDEDIIAPSLLASEISHALTKYVRGGHMTMREAIDCGSDAVSLVDKFADDSAIWIEATTESLRLGHSSYDMFYILLARRNGADLFTLDTKLQQLCEENGVSCIHTVRHL